MTKKAPRVNPLVILIPILVFLALGALVVSSAIWYTSTMTDLTFQRDDLQRYVDSSRVNDSQEEAQALKTLGQEMRIRADEVKNTLYNLSSYPDLYDEQFELIFEFAGDDIELSGYAYDRATGTLSFTAITPRVSRMPYFVQSLRDCGLFSDVQYQGYVRGTHTETGTPVMSPTTDTLIIPTIIVGEYQYAVVCRVASPTPALPPVETDDTEAEGEGGEETEEGGE
jgi:hypothetical protein